MAVVQCPTGYHRVLVLILVPVLLLVPLCCSAAWPGSAVDTGAAPRAQLGLLNLQRGFTWGLLGP